MYPYLLAVLVISVYTLYRYFKKQLSYFEKVQIPYIPGWPIFGNMANFCFGRQHFIETIHDIYNIQPEAKYVGAFNFVKPTIVIRDLELIKAVTIRHFDRFCDRPLTIDVSTDPLYGGNLFFMPGDRWRQFKSMLSPAFTSSKMKSMHELIVEYVNIFMKYLEEKPVNERQCVETKDLFSRVSNDVIASCAFGISTDSLHNPENELYVLGKEATNLVGIALLKLLLFSVFPRIMKLLGMRLVKKKTADFFIDMTENTVRDRDEKGTVRTDMMQLMMNARSQGNSEHVEMNATNMTAQAFAFYFGGFDTVSTQMSLLAHELAINQDIQRKLQAEVDEVMTRTDGKPSYEDIQGMQYLDAAFNESIRLHTQFVFLERMCIQPFELPPTLPGREPYIIEPGMMLWVPAPAINRDPKYYKNPNKFDPNRYYARSEMPSLGFGMGPRGCIGSRFAAMETKILCTYLLNKFNLLPTDKTCSPLVYDKSSFPVRPVGGFCLKFEPRN